MTTKEQLINEGYTPREATAILSWEKKYFRKAAKLTKDLLVILKRAPLGSTSPDDLGDLQNEIKIWLG